MTDARFISTSIPYVNAAPHVGFALEAVQADIIARYWKLSGKDVFFLSGTDENSLKNVLAAEKAGEDVSAFVSRHADLFEKLLAELSISNDDFIRTASDPRHARGAQKLWSSFKPEDITKKTYAGLYCVGCEEFKTEKELVDGRCPEHPNEMPQVVEEENYFFKLGNYQTRLEELIESDALRIVPQSRKNEVLSFIRSGLQDLSISRSAERARGWGVPVPGDEGQIMYVWVDALSNYINALGYADETEEFRKYWAESEDSVHAIGKGITRFHAVYWPAFLLSAGVPLPKTLFVHGYVTSSGQKMSKSLGNVIDPKEYIDRYGADAFRYFIARELSVFEDSDFTQERFEEAYTANLVNGLGNVVARVMKLAETHLPESVVRPEPGQFPKEYTDALDRFDINAAADIVWKKIQELDERLTRDEPFKVVKTDPERGREIIAECAVELYRIGELLRSFLPASSETILSAVKENKKPENLFPRL